jgi:phage terminase large subunit-like protein
MNKKRPPKSAKRSKPPKAIKLPTPTILAPKATPPSEMSRRFTAALRSDWRSLARVEQVPPPGDWVTWIFCAGRGSGKTRSGAEWVQERVEMGVAKRIHLIAPTAADCRDVMLEGASGLLSIANPQMRPTYLPSLRKVEWPNGAVALLFSADEPDRLRGPQCDTLWCDELCAMARAQEVLDMAMLGLRLGVDPRCLITTTPRPIKPFKALVARDGQDVVITRCSTMANAENLARPFLSQILQQYQGTRLGRQELNAELLLDVPGALWTLQMLEDSRLNEAPASFQRIVVGVDPSGSAAEFADQTGIVVAGLGHDQHVYILEDASGSYTPNQWATVVVELYHRYRADRVVVERNFGGDMVEHTIRTADPSVAVKAVTSSRGKVLRAEPISALWEQKRAHIVGSKPALEDQLCAFTHTWDRARDGSPDRLDAAVFAATELISGAAAPGYFSEVSLLIKGEGAPIPRNVDWIFAVAATSALAPDQVGIVYLASCDTVGGPPPLTVLDWDLVNVDDALFEKYLPALFNRIKTYVAITRASGYSAPGTGGHKGLYAQMSSGVCGAMLQHGFAIEQRVFDVDQEMPTLPPLLINRAHAAARHIHAGRVKITAEARAKMSVFRGVERNHFLHQLTSFNIGPDAPQTSSELVDAVCIGALLALDGSQREMEPQGPVAEPEPSAAAPFHASHPGQLRIM